jgi:hypothetical protein
MAGIDLAGKTDETTTSLRLPDAAALMAADAEATASLPSLSARCANCAAELTGHYCAQCGQAAHVHRSLSGLLHDLLHGVFHFEGRLWHTLPELALRPGELTRRYINGERAKFISPLALYLFAVFLLFATSSFVAGAPVVIGDGNREARQSASVEAQAETGWAALDATLNEGLKHARENPGLLLYKLKSNGYKFSWLLIPLSLPFLWLMFWWRREFRLYDHAIFITYSISFMLLLFTLMDLLERAGVPESITGLAAFVAPVHMYRQLRGAYSLSRAAAALRLMFLLAACGFSLLLFFVLLVAMGIMG